MVPLIRAMDEAQQFDGQLLKQLFELGLMGIEVAEEFGGAGGTFFEAILAVEALSAVDPSVGVLVDVQNTLCINAINRWATKAQKQRWLPRLAKDTVGAYCLSEAASGSDAFALQTRATRQGEDYVINGQKLWITNAKEAGLYLVFATVDARRRATKALRRLWSSGERQDSLSARRKTSWESALRARASWCLRTAW